MRLALTGSGTLLFTALRGGEAIAFALPESGSGLCAALDGDWPKIRGFRTDHGRDLFSASDGPDIAAGFCAVAAADFLGCHLEAPEGRAAPMDAWNALLSSAGQAPLAVPDSASLVGLSSGSMDHILRTGMAAQRSDGIHPSQTFRSGLLWTPPFSGLETQRVLDSLDAAGREAARVWEWNDGWKRAGTAPDPALALMRAAVDGHDVDAARQALRAVASPSARAVAWYGERGLPEGVARARAQAAQAVPVLAETVAEGFSREVDSGAPLFAALTDSTGLKRPALRRLAKVGKAASRDPVFGALDDMQGEDVTGINRQRLFRVSGRVDPDHAIRCLAGLPPEYVPDSDAAWAAYNDVLAAAAAPYAALSGTPLPKVLAASKGRWEDFRDTLSRAADIPPEMFGRRTMALTVSDAFTGVQQLAATAVLPLALGAVHAEGLAPADAGSAGPGVMDKAFAAALDVTVSGAKNPLGALLEFSRRHLPRTAALLGACGETEEHEGTVHRGSWGSVPDGEWPQLFDRYVHESGLHAVCLHSQSMLADESAALNHCVGSEHHGYWKEGTKGKKHFVSVRNEQGDPLSTAEISVSFGHGTPRIRVCQHRGFRNRPVSSDEGKTVQGLVDGLCGGDIPFRRGLEDWRKYMKSRELHHLSGGSRITWDSVTGLDGCMQGVRPDVWTEWRDILRGRWGKSGHPGVLFGSEAVRGCVLALSQDAYIRMTARQREAKEAAKAGKEDQAADRRDPNARGTETEREQEDGPCP